MEQEIIKKLLQKMDNAISALKKELEGLRAGRISPQLISSIKINAYGNSQTPLNQVANISTAEGRTLIINIWDESIVSNIQKAIINSELQLTPIAEGKTIKINIPPLTQERRKELVKTINKHSENYKITIRNIRRSSLEEIKQHEELSEDITYKINNKIQEITNKYIETIDQIIKKKNDEVTIN